MALKRTTKSIPLSGGMSQATTDILVEAPSMSYMENVRYDKKDTAVKAPPSAYGVVTNTSHYGHQGTFGPVGFFGENDELVAVGLNEVGVSRDGGATYTKQNIPWSTFGIEYKLSTDPAPGGTNFSFAPIGELDTSGGTPYGWTHEYYGVAYEIRDASADDQANGVSVVYELYDADNHLVLRKVHQGHRHPRVLPSYDGAQFGSTANVRQVYYTVDDSYDIYRHELTGITSVSSANNPVTPQVFTHNQLVDPAAPYKYVSAGTGLEFESHELGFARNMRQDGAMEAHFDLQGSEGILAWKTNNTTKIQFQKLDSNRTPTGSIFDLVTDTQWTAAYVLLDCKVHNGKGYILTAHHNLTLGTSVTYIPKMWEVNLSTGAVTNSLQLTGGSGRAINGSFAMGIAGGTQFDIGISIVGGDPSVTGFGDGSSNSEKVAWWHCYSWTDVKSPTCTTLNARLVSKLSVDKNYRTYGCVQQYFKASPRAGTADPKEVTAVYGAVKPVTTVMVELSNEQTSELVVPVAVFDPGQSKHMPASMMQQNSHLTDLFAYNYQYNADTAADYTDDQLAYTTTGNTSGVATVNTHFLFMNRNVVELDDISFTCMLASSARVSTTEYDGRWCLSAGQGKGNLYRIRGDALQTVNQTEWQNSMFLTTAVPAMWDGSSLFEASVLDQPEITYLKPSSGTDVSYVGYEPMLDGTASDLPKYFQAVIGFYDDNGMVHRSAPSFPVYGGNLVATSPGTSTLEQPLDVYVTPPLTTQVEGYKDRVWFCEVYMGEVGQVPRLLATKEWTPLKTGRSLKVVCNTNHNPTSTAAVKDIILSSAPIYTTGNVLAADPWPNLGTVVTTSRRLFATAVGAPGDIYYSKIYESGVSPEFNASLVISLGTGNEVHALGEIDDKVLAWTQNGVFVIYGAGPDNTGANGDFIVERLQSIAGCKQQRSVVKIPDGLLFFSDQTGQFHMITRDLVQNDIGSPIEDMSFGSRVWAAGVEPTAEEVWFSVEKTYRVNNTEWAGNVVDGPPMSRIGRPWVGTNQRFVFNYAYGKWSVVDNGASPEVGYAFTDGYMYALSSSGTSYQFGTDDWNYSNRMTLESPWIKINQLQDFGRIYMLTFIGRYLSDYADTHGAGVEAGDIQITLKYDYEDGFNTDEDVYRFRANAELLRENGDQLQLKVRPRRQKCQAIKVIIEEIATEKIEVFEPTYATGRGFEITGVDVEYGYKGGSANTGKGRKKG